MLQTTTQYLLQCVFYGFQFWITNYFENFQAEITGQKMGGRWHQASNSLLGGVSEWRILTGKALQSESNCDEGHFFGLFLDSTGEQRSLQPQAQRSNTTDDTLITTDCKNWGNMTQVKESQVPFSWKRTCSVVGNTPPRVCVWMYLCWRGGLQSVKAKRSAERSLVKVGQVTCLEEIKLAI